MLEGLPVDFLNGVGTVGVVVAVGWLVLTGKLVPRRTLEDARADRDSWRTAAEVQRDQVTKLIHDADVTEALLKSIEKRAEEVRSE
ncbi:MAG: hypothetical protein HOQ13_04500 [Dermatophilaceae bacterium]|nr:hypothetical protein [Dermatophilaceae bacterium]